ncbi:hypothetical protein JRO89_XS04G0271000 [Xanthoceras sorbifolium]|uniref:Uncharacterized protein n=1 Tax=Xanthoceras sorbifolium TaxID=99658 RepID=A0ABQ8I7K7_9ROSI|nr:hypothetical protein JRO89_XS04G0271000 [Xanthoceras sorbifolium]
MCHKCDEDCYNCRRKAVLVTEGKQNADFSRPLNFTSSQYSTVSTMSESTALNFVYRRRKLRGNSVAIFSAHDPVNTKRSNDCLSVVSSNALSLATKEQHVFQVDDESEATGTPVRPPVRSHSGPSHLRSDSVEVEHVSDRAAKDSSHKNIEVDSINDSCSSSKSNIELVSASKKTEVDGAGECSSSSVIALEFMGKGLSEKDLCISILKSEGLLERFWPTQVCASTKCADSNNSRCSRSCKICNLSETTLQMLICDNCEEAFHVSCCNPRVKEIPTDEWFCHSCLIKKCKILKETAIRKSSNISEVGRYKIASSKGESSPVELMLRDTEPYTTGVRIGKGFQANVPDWLGPINKQFSRTSVIFVMQKVKYETGLESSKSLSQVSIDLRHLLLSSNSKPSHSQIVAVVQHIVLSEGLFTRLNSDVDIMGEALELDPSESINLHELNSKNPSKLHYIGNWLQCRQVIEGLGEGVDGTICGKWRRAPLFDVQTDDWECFCSIHWDPTHADCAVPQELETDQVLKQLKYIEMAMAMEEAIASPLWRSPSQVKGGGSRPSFDQEKEDATSLLPLRQDRRLPASSH